jgi:hypothetical protein
MKEETEASASRRATTYRIVIAHMSGFSRREKGVPSMNMMKPR